MNPTLHKVIGKKAKPCRQCQSNHHWVNRIGGILCWHCRPVSDPQESVGEIRPIDGLWAPYDAADDFDFVPVAPSQRQSAPQATQRPATLVYPPNLRGPGGELSAVEIDIYTDDRVWNDPDQLIILKPRTRANQKPTFTDPSTIRRRKSRRDALPLIGSSITTTRAIKTFGGALPPGLTFIVSGADHDEFGEIVINLRNQEREVLSGILLSET